jgi:hypothetical protein
VYLKLAAAEKFFACVTRSSYIMRHARFRLTGKLHDQGLGPLVESAGQDWTADILMGKSLAG